MHDSTAIEFITDSADATGVGKWLDLDIGQYLVHELRDTAEAFPAPVSNHPIENEPEQIRQDVRVKRIPEGLQFNLSNGKAIIRQEDK